MGFPADVTCETGIYAGDPWAWGFSITDAAGDPYDLSDRPDARCQLRRRPGAPILASPTVTRVGPGLHTFRLDLTATVTAGLPEGQIEGDVEIHDGPGDPLTVVRFTVTVRQDITR